jgi:exportin-1
MIKLNFTEFPEHRAAFYSLLAAITEHCFVTLLQLPPQAFKVVVDSVIWAFHHQERKIADIGLKMCSDLIVNVSRLPAEHQGISNAFVQAFFLHILQSVFDVLTDTLHKPGFASQCEIINLLLQHVVSNRVTVPLWDVSKENYSSNVEFISQHLLMQISSRFPHLQPPQVMQFVSGLLNFQVTLEQKRILIRNFLVEVNIKHLFFYPMHLLFFFNYSCLIVKFQLKQFKDQENNADLFREETESRQRAIAAQDTQRRLVRMFS